MSFALSPGQAGDAPEGRNLLQAGGRAPLGCPLIMDRAYEGDENRQLALELGFTPVVPPKSNRFSRFDKLDVMFTAFIHLALIVDALISVNTP